MREALCWQDTYPLHQKAVFLPALFAHFLAFLVRGEL